MNQRLNGPQNWVGHMGHGGHRGTCEHDVTHKTSRR